MAAILAFSAPLQAADIENCLLCHKYPGMSRIDQDGKFRLFYVNEHTYNQTVHSRTKCQDCHKDIKKIPHENVKKVDCLTQCHIEEPTSEQKFSHQSVAKFLEASVHGEIDRNGRRKKHPEDLPGCKDCHENPLYRPLSFYKTVQPGISEAALGRCRVCHKKDEFIYRFYNHVTTRLHTTRSPLNVAEVCERCHDDPRLIERHDLKLKAVESYYQTFHGKAARFRAEAIPSCLDCHINRGQSVHQMLRSDNPQSITYEKNRFQACSMTECHPTASPALADYQVHPTFSPKIHPWQFYFAGLFILLAGGTLLPLMGILLFDITRKIFPNISLRRKK